MKWRHALLTQRWEKRFNTIERTEEYAEIVFEVALIFLL